MGEHLLAVGDALELLIGVSKGMAVNAQGGIDLLGQGRGKGPLQGPGFPRPLQALQIGADIGAPARLLALKVQ